MKNNILYKYSSLENTRKILNSKTLKLTNPNDFNDPFDCNIPTIEYNFNRISKKVKNIFLKSNGKGSNISKKKWNKEFFEFDQIKNELLEFFKSIKKDWEKYIGFYRILSLTKNNNSILMWSHYADHHKGVVLGFDFSDSKTYSPIKQVKYNNKDNLETKKFFDKVFIDIFNELAMNINTEYSEDKFAFKLMSHLHLYFFIKNEVWSYENEYRLVLKDKRKFLDFKNTQLKEIIFGIKVSKEERELFLKDFDYLNSYDIFIAEEKNNKLNLVKLDNYKE